MQNCIATIERTIYFKVMLNINQLKRRNTRMEKQE